MEIISDSVSISGLQVLKPSVTDANLGMVVLGFWWILKVVIEVAEWQDM